MAGRLVHFEVRAGDWERAKTFYGSLFGWKFSEWGGPVDYSLVDAGGDPGGALYPTTTAERGIVVYFGVDDMDAALAQVRALGGEVLGEKQPVPGVGYTARCRDTEGNDFALFHSDETAAPPA